MFEKKVDAVRFCSPGTTHEKRFSRVNQVSNVVVCLLKIHREGFKVFNKARDFAARWQDPIRHSFGPGWGFPRIFHRLKLPSFSGTGSYPPHPFRRRRHRYACSRDNVVLWSHNHESGKSFRGDLTRNRVSKTSLISLYPEPG